MNNNEFWDKIYQHGIDNQLIIVRKSPYRFLVVRISKNSVYRRAFTLPTEQYVANISGDIVFEGKYDACEALIEKNVNPIDTDLIKEKEKTPS